LSGCRRLYANKGRSHFRLDLITIGNSDHAGSIINPITACHSLADPGNPVAPTRIYHHWLLAVVGSLSTWILAWSIRPQAPLNLPLANWQPRVFLPISPALLLDSKSWPFIIALTTLTLTAVITDVARPSTSRSPDYWYDLIAYLVLTAFSLLATLSGNLLTLLLSWTLLAGVELILRLSKIQESIQADLWSWRSPCALPASVVQFMPG